jgi:hypothetical protein
MKTIEKLVLALLLVVSNAGALAEWGSVEKFEDNTEVFADPTRAQRSGDLAQLRHLVRWGEPQTEDGHPPYRSTVVRMAYDCRTRKEKYLASISYAGANGDGEKIVSDEDEAESWAGVSEASMEEKLWTIACGAERP